MQSPEPAGSNAPGGFREGLEFGLRFAFFAGAPVILMWLSELVPMTAAMVNMAIALSTFFFAEVVRRWTKSKGWLARVFRRQLEFDAFYRQHPPKPFAYYLFYPLLFPYWLYVKEARRELWLFKGYTLLTLSVAILTGIYRLFWVYRPELGFRSFLVPFFWGLLLESIAVIMLIMPISTSVVALHLRGQRNRLLLLIGVGLLSATATSFTLAHRARTRPSLETRYRLEERTKARPTFAEQAMTGALRAAWARRGSGERLDEGILAGPPLEAAHHELARFYRDDEAAAFDLWETGVKDRKAMIVLIAEGRSKKHRPIFLGMRADGGIVRKGGDLPPGARRIVRDVEPL